MWALLSSGWLDRSEPAENCESPIMSSHYDAVIIGGGHNGLVNAAYLARAGKKVLVLERRQVLGGAAVTEEVFPGFKFSVCSYVVSLLRPEIDRKSTRLNSSHPSISYAVFCLKKKT